MPRRNGSWESDSSRKDNIKRYAQDLHEPGLDIGLDMDAVSAPENCPLLPNVDIVEPKEKFLLNHCESISAFQLTRVDDNTSSLG